MKRLTKYWYWIPIFICCYCIIRCWFITPSKTTVFLVRHADRMGNADALSPAGDQRAIDLKDVLKDAEIDIIFSSDYVRTRNTAQPLATHLGIPVTLYDAGDIPALVSTIKTNHKGKRILVVGHSNTVPETINQYGILPALVNIPHSTFNRMYQLIDCKPGSVDLIKMHYGQ